MLDTSHTPCKDGARRLFVHQTETGENTHFAITGEEIQDYSEEGRSAAYEECQPGS